jgi:BCD family chlorophyll transporter-like MFS transporter
VAIAFAGVARDRIAHAAAHGGFGAVVDTTADAHATGYLSIYAIEILLLFATLIVIGPLAKFRLDPTTAGAFALPELPPSSPAYGKARP